MGKEILIQVQKNETLVSIVQNRKVDDFFIEKKNDQSLLGNIYKGRVESILPSINAAFVDIGEKRNGFLYLTDVLESLEGSEVINPLVKEPMSNLQKITEKLFNIKKDEILDDDLEPAEPKKKKEGRGRHKKHKLDLDKIPLKEGQEILVQVVKDAFAGKGPRLTSQISLPGRFVVYMPFEKHIRISRKIDNAEERKRLRELLKDFSAIKTGKTGGFIIRTVALKKGAKELVRDAKFFVKLWSKIQKKSEKESAPSVLYEEGELTWKIVRDYLTDEIDKVMIDSEEEYKRFRKFVQTLIGRHMVNKIEHYDDQVSLFQAKKIAKDLRSIYNTNVYLKSGAYIIIEPTEGLIVVDVNSGKFKAKNSSPDEAAFIVNLAVVPEIARQLRLRDLGGIIVIDFIDMKKEDHKKKIFEALKQELAKDHAKTEVLKISSLGLIEMTRERTGKNIESISFNRCPFCSGRGKVKII